MKIRVLVIDDDEDLLFLAGKFLSREDERFELVSALTDQEALRRIEEEEFDAIVCDHFLGQDSMTGLELLEWVREFNPSIPFIIFTGRSQEAVAIRALNLGADYYLKKGTDEFRDLFTQLADRIRTEVEARRAEEALSSAMDELEARVEQRTSELKEMNERLKREIAEKKKVEDSLLLQRDLGNTLCKTENLIDALDIILKAAVQLEGIDTGGIFLVDEKTGQLDLSTSQGISSQFLKGILGQDGNIELKAPIYMTSKEIPVSTDKPGQYEGLTAAAVLPILFEDKTIAILSLGSHSHEDIPKTEKHTLEGIAIQISAYMARVRAQQTIQESQGELMNMFDTLGDLLFIVDNAGFILQVNTTAASRLAMNEMDMFGKNILDFYQKDRQSEVSEIIQGTKKGEVVRFGVPLISEAGETIQSRTRIVRGRHSGKDVLFIVSRESVE
ncbi:MAG: response regulator [Candidatus Thorarchaeota archaeon]